MQGLECLEGRQLLSADLSVIYTADNSTYQVGNTITLTAVATAAEDSDTISSGSGEVYEIMPSGFTYSSLSAPDWSSTFYGSNIDFLYEGGDLSAGQTAPSIVVTGTLTSAAVPSATFSARAGVGGNLTDTGNVTVTVNPSTAATNLAVASATGTYGGTTTLSSTLTSGGVPVAGESVDFQIGSSIIGTATTNSNGVASLSNVPLSSINAGTYTGDVSASFSGDSSYGSSSGSAGLTVAPAPLTITADDQDKAYGAALPDLTVSYSGFVNGDTASSLATPPTITTTATAASHVAGSPYAITASGAVDSNYSISYVGGHLTVTPAPLTITANNLDKVYGAVLPTFTASYTGLVNGDVANSLGEAPTLSTTAGIYSDVLGSPYTITASGAVDSDYSISYVAGTLSVTPAPVQIAINYQNRLYGQANPTLTAVVTGVLNGDNYMAEFGTTASTTSGVGGYLINFTGASGVKGEDYSPYVMGGLISNGTLTVAPAPLTITADDQDKAYGAALPDLTVSYSGFVNGDTASSLATPPTITTTATAASHVAGSPYAITASGAVDSNYSISYVGGHLTVTPASLTITAINATKVYGAALPTLTASYNGLVNDDAMDSLESLPTLTTTATSTSHVAGNPYTITASGAVDPDYAISYVSGGLTVTPAPLMITASGQSKVYGAAMPTLTASYSGLVNGDTLGSLTTAPTFMTTATAASQVEGSPYTITATGAFDPDYTISYASGNLTVTPATLMITANGQTKVYGAALPAYTASYAGLVNGDTPASLSISPTISSTASAYTDVSSGPVAITATGAFDPNYSISYAQGMLTITPAPIQVSINNQTIVYGQVIPSLTATVTGVLGDDNVVADLTSTASQYSPVQNGGYAITLVGLTGPKADDYSTTVEGGSETPGTLMVTAAPLTVTVANQSKTYGHANPTLTGSVMGVLNGDNVQVVYNTTAGQYSDVLAGGYPISVMGLTGAASGNYSLSVEGASVTPGTMSVTPAPLLVVVANQAKFYGQTDPVLTGAVAGVLNGDNVTVNYATTANASSHVVANGYPITVTGLSGSKAGDYAISSNTPGTMTVVPAPLMVAANNAAKMYGQADLAFTALINGLVLGQGGSVLTGSLTYSTAANATTPVGSYPVMAGGLSSTDYAINYVAGTLTNTPAPLVITAPSPALFYGSTTPSMTPSYSGFVNGDTPASLTGTVTETTPLTAKSNVGFYPIVPGGATDPNYAISYRFGVASVYPVVLTETASSAVGVAGQPLPAFTVSYHGFVNGDTAANLTSPATAYTPATSASAPGFYPVFLSGGSSNNYIVEPVGGILDLVAPQPVTPPLNPGQVAFVTTLYTELLGRTPEPTGTAFWIGQLNDGVTRASVAQQIYHSPEAVSYRAAHKGHTIGLAQALSDAQKAQLLAS